MNGIIRLAVLAGLAVAGILAAEAKTDWSKYKWAVIGDSLSDPRLDPVGGKYYDIIQRETGIECHDWLNGQNDPKYDFHQIDRKTGSVEFAKKYTRDYNETRSYGHPSAAYNAEWMAPAFRKILEKALK